MHRFALANNLVRWGLLRIQIELRVDLRIFGMWGPPDGKCPTPLDSTWLPRVKYNHFGKRAEVRIPRSIQGADENNACCRSSIMWAVKLFAPEAAKV
mmetsp:Transcript_2194/g.7575  ORF Transcript_2194/g.7575 Transcript_2194/m.7575 type:complete len:97 (+) Transcript_2194:123-413(+)